MTPILPDSLHQPYPQQCALINNLSERTGVEFRVPLLQSKVEIQKGQLIVKYDISECP